MKTYNTYQEAKIAMPLACIIEDTGSGLFFGMPTREGTTLAGGSRFAEPQDYCMTVEKFLADGYRFVDGDAYTNEDGGVIVVGRDISCSRANATSAYDNSLCILRAAALEEENPFLQTGEELEHTKTLNFIYDRLINVHGENASYDYMHKLKNAIASMEDIESPCNTAENKEKPRTKVEYVKVDKFSFKLNDDFIGGNLYVKILCEYSKVVNDVVIPGAMANDKLYRRIETPIEWWEDAASYVNSTTRDSCNASCDGNVMHIRASMTRDQWCDFARILIEQSELID